MKAEARSRAYISGNRWESQLTAFQRRVMRMTFEQRELPYEDEREELFHKEVYR